MIVTADARNPAEIETDLLVVPVAALDGTKPGLGGRAAALDRALGGALQRAIDSGDFRGKEGQKHLIYPDSSLPARRVLLIGLGAEKDLGPAALRKLGGNAVGEGRSRRADKVALLLPHLRRARIETLAQAVAEGGVLANYRFDEFRSAKNGNGEEMRHAVAALQLNFEPRAELRTARLAIQRGVRLAECQNLARELSNQPGNRLPPEALAQRARAVARETGLGLRVLGVPELKKRGMGGILAVGGGSMHPPRLIALEHRPRGRARPSGVICLIGKGITFDSGGLSIKPAASMDEMKHDMSGAAAVLGALRACALLELPLHVVGILGAAENLPSGTAYRPGDILVSASSKTIEVLNTDAEGRVVLADAIHYAKQEYSPQVIVDLATLTGACVVALGNTLSGAFANHEGLLDFARRAGERCDERIWPMPVEEEHRKAIKSEVADLKNTGGREAGASTAAAFLQAFVGDTPWLHLDIAGTGWTTRASACQPRGATGVGVRWLVEMLTHWKELRLD